MCLVCQAHARQGEQETKTRKEIKKAPKEKETRRINTLSLSSLDSPYISSSPHSFVFASCYIAGRKRRRKQCLSLPKSPFAPFSPLPLPLQSGAPKNYTTLPRMGLSPLPSLPLLSNLFIEFSRGGTCVGHFPDGGGRKRMAAVVGPSAAGCGGGGGQDLSKSGPKLGGYYCRYGEEGWRMWWWPNATQKVFCSLSPSCRSLVVLFLVPRQPIPPTPYFLEWVLQKLEETLS